MSATGERPGVKSPGPGHEAAGAVALDREAVTESELIGLARSGDQEAFGRIMESHLEKVWVLVWRVLRHREDTEDVVQEVFLTAWRSLPGFRGEASLATWLGRIAVTRALNHLERGAEKVRRGAVPLEADPGDGPRAPGLIQEPADARPAASPLRVLEARDLGRRLTDCLDRLPPAWRAALALRHQDQRPYEEIARALGLALGTVRSRLSRARLALRECVESGT
jgi:RNA polymerase sigma-70 factor (ECF subfamily)